MDRNGLIGLLMIGAILIGWQYFTAPSAEEIAAQKEKQDSIQLAQKQIKEQASLEEEVDVELAPSDSELVVQDSIANLEQLAKYGSLASASEGTEKIFEVKTPLLDLKFSNKGGRLIEAKLRNYKSYDDYMAGEDKSLVLVSSKGNESYFKFPFENRNLKSDEFYFDVEGHSPEIFEGDSLLLSFIAEDANGKQLRVSYTIFADSYLLGYAIDGEVLNGTSELNLTMNLISQSKEKGKKFENRIQHFSTNPGMIKLIISVRPVMMIKLLRRG